MSSAGLVGFLMVWAGALQAAEALPTVSWDATGLTAAQYQRIDALALERSVVLRLMEEGFAAVWAPTPATVLIRVGMDAQQLHIEASGPAGQFTNVVRLDRRSPAEVHLEIIHKAVELARAASASRPAPPPLAPPEPLVNDTNDGHAWSLGGALGGGVRWRSGNPDAQGRAGLRLMLGESASADVGVGFIRSHGTGIAVEEWEILAGAGLRWDIAGPVYAATTLLVGPLIHHFSIADDVATPASGTRVQPIGALALGLGVLVWRNLGIELSVVPTVSPALSHHFADTLLWRRPAFCVETALLLAWQPN